MAVAYKKNKSKSPLPFVLLPAWRCHRPYRSSPLSSHATALADGLSEGHYYMFGKVFRVGKFMPPAGLPFGGLIASVEDMTHYAVAQLNSGRYGDSPILSPLGIAELHVPSISAGGRGGFENSGLGRVQSPDHERSNTEDKQNSKT